MKFKEHLSESLNSPVEFTITDDTQMPNQFYAVTQVNGTDYGFALYRTKYDRVYTLEMYRVVTKKKRFWSFKTAADVRIVMSTLMKFVEAVYPFVKNKMDGAILEIPSGSASESYLKFLTLIVNKFYIKTFVATPVVKTTDKASNYLFVTKKVVKPENIFKTAVFHKHFNFGSLPTNTSPSDTSSSTDVPKGKKPKVGSSPVLPTPEQFDEIKEPLKVQPITLSYNPDPKFALGAFEVTSLADLSVMAIDSVTPENSKVTTAVYSGKVKDPNKTLEPKASEKEEPEADVKYGFNYSAEADTKKYAPTDIPFFHFVTYIASVHKVGNAKILIKSIKTYLKHKEINTYSSQYKMRNSFRDCYHFANKLLKQMSGKSPGLIAGMDSVFLSIHDNDSNYYGFKENTTQYEKTEKMVEVYQKTLASAYTLKKNSEIFENIRKQLELGGIYGKKTNSSTDYSYNKEYNHSKIEIPIVLKSGIKAFQYADEGVFINTANDKLILEPGNINKTQSKKIAISAFPEVKKFISELGENPQIKETIRDYTGTSSGILNNPMRNYIKGDSNIYSGIDVNAPDFYEKITKKGYGYSHKERILIMIENMLRAFEMSPIAEQSFWVYRNAGFEGNVNKEVGEELIDAGAMSTSLDPELDLGSHGNTRLKIFVPKGARFLPVYTFSKVKGESEIILPPMSVLKITEKYTTQSNSYNGSKKVGFVCVWTGTAFKSTVEKMRDGKAFTLKEELENQDESNLKKEAKWKDQLLDAETQKKVLKAIENGEIKLDD